MTHYPEGRRPHNIIDGERWYWQYKRNGGVLGSMCVKSIMKSDTYPPPKNYMLTHAHTLYIHFSSMNTSKTSRTKRDFTVHVFEIEMPWFTTHSTSDDINTRLTVVIFVFFWFVNIQNEFVHALQDHPTGAIRTNLSNSSKYITRLHYELMVQPQHTAHAA